MYEADMPPLVLIGEAPGGPPNCTPSRNGRPLWPAPRGCAGHRLQQLTGMDQGTYLRGTERTNLVYWVGSPAPWPTERARQRAEGLSAWLKTLRDDKRTRTWAIMCGARVRDAFGLREADPLEWYRDGRLSWMVIPHPSGRNTVWNDPAVREQLRTRVAEALPDIETFLAQRLQKPFVTSGIPLSSFPQTPSTTSMEARTWP